jgi:hypothetical protein
MPELAFTLPSRHVAPHHCVYPPPAPRSPAMQQVQKHSEWKRSPPAELPLCAVDGPDTRLVCRLMQAPPAPAASSRAPAARAARPQLQRAPAPRPRAAPRPAMPPGPILRKPR